MRNPISKKERTTDLSIERARPADRRAVVSLLAAQMSEHRTRSETIRLSRIYDQLLADERFGFLLVARLRGGIAGVAYVATILSVEHGGPVGWLEELYVTPEHRNAGVGGALLERAIATARELGLVALDLEVDRAHRRAESLYSRYGFQPLRRSRWVKPI
jgi:GNAT superfamily N-acetyltransferase